MAFINIIKPIYTNVAQYGGDPTGATASDSAFSLALAAIPTSTGGVLYIPPNSTYLLNNGLDISAYNGNLVILGGGMSSVLKLANGANTYLIKNTSGSQQAARISNLKLDCNSAGQTSASGGIYGYKYRRCVIDNVWIHNPWQAGIYLIGDAGDFGYQNRIHNCWIEGGSNVSSGTNAYGNGLRLENTDENEIYANHFEANGNFNDGTYGFHVYDKNGLSAYTDNSFVNGAGVFKLDGLQDVIKGNRFDGCGGNYVQVNGSASDTIIEDNQMFNVGFRASGGSANAVNAIYLNAPRCMVRNNNFWTDASATPKTRAFVNIDTGATYCNVEENEFNIRTSSGTLAGAVTFVSGAPAGTRVRNNNGYDFVNNRAIGLTDAAFNVKDFGAAVDSATDDTSIISSVLTVASNAGGGTVVLPGICAISSPLTVPANVQLVGTGQNSGLKILAGFSGAQAVLLSGDFAQVRDMQIVGGPSTTYSSNPALNAIQITGARRCIVDKIVFYYINGYMVQSSSSASVANYNCRFTNNYGLNCAKGFHTLGTSATSYGMSAFLSGNSMDFSTGSGDCYLFEDSNDILMENCYGEYLGGTGNSLRIHGACNAIYVSNFDLGPFPGPIGNVVVIESGTNGSPSYIGFSNGIIEGGSIGVSMTAGQQVVFRNVEFYNNNTAGVNIAGGLGYIIDGCFFNLNGASAGSGRYDFVSTTAGKGTIRNCTFLTPQGSGAGQTNNAVNVTAGTVMMSDCSFYGTGYNSGNIFASKPTVIRSCPGYNPLGHSVTQPAVPASTVAVTNTTGVDCAVHIAGGTLTVVSIGGSSVGITAAAPAGSVHSVRVPAVQTIAITYTVAPTWQWFGD